MDIYILYRESDLEGRAISEFKYIDNVILVNIEGTWGNPVVIDEKLEEHLINAKNSRHAIILVELHDPWLREKYRDKGELLRCFDHHIVISPGGKIDDRRHPLSSLEQLIVSLREEFGLGGSLTDEVKNGKLGDLQLDWRLIAASDHGFRPALAAAAYKYLDPDARDADCGKMGDIIERYRDEELRKVKGSPQIELLNKCKSIMEDKKNKYESTISHERTWYDNIINNIKTEEESDHKITVDISDDMAAVWGRLPSEELDLIYLDENYRAVAADAFYCLKTEGELKGIEKCDSSILKNLRMACYTKHRNVLFLFGAGDDAQKSSLTSLFLSLGPGSRDYIYHLVEHVEENYALTRGMKCRAGGYDAGYFEAGYFEAEGDAASLAEGDAASLGELADYILNGLLGANRPIAAWRSNFFYPLQVKDGMDDQSHKQLTDSGFVLMQDSPSAQERDYYLSHVKERLFPKPEAAIGGAGKAPPGGIRSYEKKVEPGLSIALTTFNWDGTQNWTGGRPIEAIRAHHLCKDFILLEWQFSDEWKDVIADGDKRLKRFAPGHKPSPYWRELLGGVSERWVMDDLLRWNAGARFIFSPFTTEDKTSHVEITLKQGVEELASTLYGGPKPEAGEDSTCGATKHDWFARFCHLALPEIFTNTMPAEKVKDACLFDERAHVLSSVVLTGDPPQEASARKRFDALIARFYDVSGPGEGFPYDEKFCREELVRASYSRFKSLGSIYAASSHSFVYAGFGEYAYPHIHERHMQEMYRTFFIIMQLYRGILHRYEAHLPETLKELSSETKPNLKLVRSEHESYLKFANNYFFPELTLQEQGRELNKLLWDRARFKDMFGRINNSLRQLDEMLTLKKKEKEARIDKQSENTRYALQNWVAPFATFATLLSLINNIKISTDHSIMTILGGMSSSPWFVVALLMFSIGIVRLILVYFGLSKPLENVQVDSDNSDDGNISTKYFSARCYYAIREFFGKKVNHFIGRPVSLGSFLLILFGVISLVFIVYDISAQWFIMARK